MYALLHKFGFVSCCCSCCHTEELFVKSGQRNESPSKHRVVDSAHYMFIVQALDLDMNIDDANDENKHEIVTRTTSTAQHRTSSFTPPPPRYFVPDKER